MSDLTRMKHFYLSRETHRESAFECYSFFLACKQKWMLLKILKHLDLSKMNLLDIGAGEGNFLLTMLGLGINPKNITAIEYLEHRIVKLQGKLPHIQSHQMDYLEYSNPLEPDLITIMAVLTSITDNELRYALITKAFSELKKGGYLIIYDFFNDNEHLVHKDYRAISLVKVQNVLKDGSITLHKNVYLKSKYAKGLCKIGLSFLIPTVESLKIFNDSYHFVVVQK